MAEKKTLIISPEFLKLKVQKYEENVFHLLIKIPIQRREITFHARL